MSKNIKNFIKTDCGLSKYYLLKSKKGFFNTIRFYWFVMIATIIDLPKFRQDWKLSYIRVKNYYYINSSMFSSNI